MSNAATVTPEAEIQGQILAYLTPGTSIEDTARLIQQWQLTLPQSLDLEVAINNLGETSSTLGDAVSTDADRLPDVVVSLCGENDADIKDHLQALCETLRDQLSPQSTVLGSQRYRILDGEGPIRLFYAIRRLPHMTRSQFQHYWLHHHADTGRQLIPPYSYLQSHTHDGLTTLFSQACGLAGGDFDGIVAIHFPDMDACQRQISREDVATIALEDEKKFIDHSRVLFGNYSLLGTT